MALVSEKEIADGSAGAESIDGTASVTRAWRVTTNSNLDNPQTLRTQISTTIGDPHPANSFLTVHGIDWDRGPGKKVWVYTATYETNQPVSEEQREAQQVPNPLDRRAKLSGEAVQYEKLITKDRDGNAMMTSASEPYPALAIDDSRWILHVRKNYSGIPSWLYTIENKVNAAAVQILGSTLAKETLKVSGCRFSEVQEENGVLYREIQFDLHYREEGFKVERLDAGFYEVTGANTKPTRIVDNDDEPFVVEQLLDGNGEWLGRTQSMPFASGLAVFNSYFVYETADFSVLPLAELQ